MKGNHLDMKIERPKAKETMLRTTTGVKVENPSVLETGNNDAIRGDHNPRPDPASISHSQEYLQALITYLEERFGLEKQELERLLPENKIRHHLLWCLFPLGSEIIFKDPTSGVTCAGKVLLTLF